VNPLDVVVAHEHARWAVELVKRDVAVLLGRFQSGDVGEGDGKLRADLVAVINKYMSEGLTGKAWQKEAIYHSRGCIRGAFLSTQTASRAAFRKHRLGADNALKNTLATMVEYGLLVQLDKKTTQGMFNSVATFYALGDAWQQG